MARREVCRTCEFYQPLADPEKDVFWVCVVSGIMTDSQDVPKIYDGYRERECPRSLEHVVAGEPER
jgi:hypothetical protein